MTAERDKPISRALALWGLADALVEGTPRDHHGLSGVQVWRVLLGKERFAVRWYDGSRNQVEQIAGTQAFMRHAARSCPFVPLPRPTMEGQTVVAVDSGCWSLEPWMPGEPAATPSREPIKLAVKALWQLHEATRDSRCFGPFNNKGTCRAVERRRQVLQEWFSDGIDESRRRTEPRPSQSNRATPNQSPTSEYETNRNINRLRQLLPHAAQHALPLVTQAAGASTQRQPIVGDIRRAHVLFSSSRSDDGIIGERVTGLVDYGAVTVDSPMVDLARLLGEMAGDDIGLWTTGLAAYQEQRRLSDQQRRLIAALDAGGVVGASINWLRWLAEGVVAPSPAVADRLGELADRLESISHGNLTAARAIAGGAA